MADWDDLRAELARWDSPPKLWWRDDDARSVTPALERLLDLSARHQVIAHLAVIPVGLEDDLAPRLADEGHLRVLQHGLAHRNHEPDGSPASEVGDNRDLPMQRADLREGWDILKAARMPHLLPGLVPPWNRIGDATRAKLPEWGYTYLSSYEGRGAAGDVAGLFHLDAHLDPIRWKHGATFRGVDKMLDMLIAHLEDRRQNRSDRPIGYVTHHLQTGEEIWDFTDRLFAETPGMWHDLPALRLAR